MTDQTQENTDQPVTELDMLKARAKLMGIKHSNNISVEALREKISNQLSANQASSDDDEPEADEPEADVVDHGITAMGVTAPSGAPQPLTEPTPAPMVAPAAPRRPLTKAQRDQEIRVQLHRECMKLIRCRITNLNPAKKDLPGEVFVVGNKYLGTVKKFIPFGEATDDGYHIPKILYDELVARKFQQISVKRDSRTKTNMVQTRWVREFAIEVLPQLTAEELARLATAQAAAGSVDTSADNSL